MNTNKISSRYALPVDISRHPGVIVPAWIAAAWILAGPALAAPGGELDATFGENGRLTIGEAGFGEAVLQQADGKLLVLIGYATGTGDDFESAVIRLHPDGSRDGSFGTNGKAVIDFAGIHDYASEIELQSDGKIIAAGTRTGATGSDIAVARFNANGSIDATFGGGGAVILDLGGGEYFSAIILQENGQVVLAGTTSANGVSNIAFARLETDGALDPTFGTGPIAGTTLVDTNGAPTWITRQLDGKYVACGVADAVFWDYIGTMMAVRINADGSIDNGFGINGVSRIETSALASTCVAMPDGTMVLGGLKEQDLAFARLTSDGAKDTTFGNAGIVRLDLGGVESVEAMVPLNDGGLGIVGRIATVRGNVFGIPTDMFFARVDPDSGLLDPAFGNNGVTIVDFGLASQTAWSEGLALFQQTDGKLVAAGTTSGPDIALARVDPGGAGNVGFGGFVETFVSIIEGTAELELSVRRTGGSTGTLSVQYATVVGTAGVPADFTPSFGSLVWVDGDTVPKTIIVLITDDNVDEPNETFTVVLSNSTGGLASSELLVTISDRAVAEPPPAQPPTTGAKIVAGGGAVFLELLICLLFARLIPMARQLRGRQSSRQSY